MTPRHVISYWVWLREMDIWEGLFDEMEWSFRVFYVIRILRQLWADILKGEKRNLIFLQPPNDFILYPSLSPTPLPIFSIPVSLLILTLWHNLLRPV